MTAKKKITNKNGVQVFPITHTKAVIDDNGNSVEQRLEEQMDVINQKQLEVGAVPSDIVPTAGSTNWVTSGGVYDALSSPISCERVSIGNGSLQDFFKTEGEYTSSSLINTQYAKGTVGGTVEIKSNSSLKYQVYPIKKGDKLSLKSKGFGDGLPYLITDSNGLVLEAAPQLAVELTDYVVPYDDASLIYTNCKTDYLDDYFFSFISVSAELANDYNGGTKRIASAEIVKTLHGQMLIDDCYETELCFGAMSAVKNYSADSGDVLYFEFAGNTGTRTRLDYYNGETYIQLFSLGGDVDNYTMTMPASFTKMRNYGDTSVYVKITNLTKKQNGDVRESVKTLIGSKRVESTLHFDGTKLWENQAFLPLEYPINSKSVLKIYNIVKESGNAIIELHNGDRSNTDTSVLINQGNTYYIQPEHECTIIGCWAIGGTFTCDIDVIQTINSWDNPALCYGKKVATLGDSITAYDHCNIGLLSTMYLRSKLINNFALGQAYAADWASTVPYLHSTPNSDTADNVLSNQVRRLLQWTTEEGEQITWTHPWDGEFSLETSVGVGLGHTDDIPDIIYIAIGTNDPSTKVDDDITPVTTASYSNLTRQTIASGYRWAIETLQSAYPNAMIFLASPIWSGYGDPTIQTKKGDIVKKICDLTGAIYIPSREESGYTRLATKNGGTLHPSGKWPYKIGKFVAKKISEAIKGTFYIDGI